MSSPFGIIDLQRLPDLYRQSGTRTRFERDRMVRIKLGTNGNRIRLRRSRCRWLLVTDVTRFAKINRRLIWLGFKRERQNRTIHFRYSGDSQVSL